MSGMGQRRLDPPTESRAVDRCGGGHPVAPIDRNRTGRLWPAACKQAGKQPRDGQGWRKTGANR
jgi:hypothetical protein